MDKVLKEVFYSEQTNELDFFRRASCQFGAFTARSPSKRSANEDCAGWIRLGRDNWVFLVADGLGGLPAGDAASQLAISSILDHLSDKSSGSDIRGAIIQGIDLANEAILSSTTGGATTLVVVEFDQDSIRPYHVGDATILVTGQRGRLKFQSVSHSPTGYLEEAGLLNEKDAMLHESRHIVSNVVGSDAMRLEIGPRIELAKYDTVVMASDGLRDNLSLNQVTELVRKGPLDKCLEKLTKSCHRVMGQKDEGKPGHPDDLTIIALRRSHKRV